ncbi:hypothetical protein [Streptomyces lydicamycinicus]|uniref:hypothetical protein n=1 Tax=Streptomyces lydicamycinicus TaxID=1546107 RepID=UPI003C2FBA08
MPRYSRARLNKEADYFDRQASRSDAAARSGDQAAADPAGSDHIRACAARAAEIARGNANEYRHIAASLREGEIPDNVRLD